MSKALKQAKSKGDRGNPKWSWTQLSGVRSSANSRETRRLTSWTNTVMTTGAGGAFAAGPIVANNGASSATEWSSFAARFTEARVLAVRVTLFPRYPQGYFAAATGATAAAQGQVVLVSDRSGQAPALTSMGQAVAFAGVIRPTSEKVSLEVRATDLEDQLFTATTGAITLNFRILTGCQNIAAGVAVAHYDMLSEWMVEFQSPQ